MRGPPMRQFSSLFEDRDHQNRIWPFGQRRQSERMPCDLVIRVSRHRNDTVSRHVSTNVSNGGMMLEPTVDGYVGEHLYLTAEPLFTEVEARITHQYGNATGVAFVQRIDRPDVVKKARS
jgi:hypothetical protein